jgi:hypothetical protein
VRTNAKPQLPAAELGFCVFPRPLAGVILRQTFGVSNLCGAGMGAGVKESSRATE